MNNMVQIVVVIASVLLGMILYPILLKKWKHLLDWLYVCTYGKTEEEPKGIKLQETALKEEKITSIVGKSKFNLRQSTPNTATDLKSENPIEKASTFASPTDSDPEKLDISEPLEKIEDLPQEEFDSQEEEIGLDEEEDAVLASGVVYDELFKTKQTIENPNATGQEEKDAGRVIYQQEGTNIFQQVVASSQETALRIANLIDIHLKDMVRYEPENIFSVNEGKQMDSLDFKNFDINNIF